MVELLHGGGDAETVPEAQGGRRIVCCEGTGIRSLLHCFPKTAIDKNMFDQGVNLPQGLSHLSPISDQGQKRAKVDPGFLKFLDQ